METIFKIFSASHFENKLLPLLYNFMFHMKPTVRMLLFVVLATHPVSDQCIDCRPEDVTEMKAQMRFVSPRKSKTPCGLRPAYTRPRNRGSNPSDEEDDEDDYLDNNMNMDKIMAGLYTSPGQFPWHANIIFQNRTQKYTHCGGAILSEYWIISSLQCFQVPYSFDYFRIIVGDRSRLRTDPGEQTLLIKVVYGYTMRMDKFWKDKGLEGGIALIKIASEKNDKGIIFNDYVQAICMPSWDDQPRKVNDFFISGFGVVMPDWDSNETLLLKEMDAKQEFDKKVYPDDTYLTLEKLDGLPCIGDSGSPVVQKTGGVFMLYGLVELPPMPKGEKCPLGGKHLLVLNIHRYHWFITPALGL